MNFDEAISAHFQWKKKLTAYIANPDQSLSAVASSSDSNCALGKWLRGEGQQYSAEPNFVKLCAEHSRFHKAAGAIVAKANAGQQISADVALGRDSEYFAASTAVILALTRMKQAVQRT